MSVEIELSVLADLLTLVAETPELLPNALRRIRRKQLPSALDIRFERRRRRRMAMSAKTPSEPKSRRKRKRKRTEEDGEG
jgi:hypothetical protein